MNDYDIIVIGGGCAGLMAARELSVYHHKILILEAKEYLGGRIYSVGSEQQPIALGAEFVHGNLPLTFNLIKQAGLECETVNGESFRLTDGILQKQEDFIKDWDLLMQKLSTVKHDCSLLDFLNKEFSEPRYGELCESVVAFVQGYDAADPSDVSVLALKEEWAEEMDEQYRIKGGYGQLVNYLERECKKNNVDFKLNSEVHAITWEAGFAEVKTSAKIAYSTAKVIVTVPLGVLKSQDISYLPPLKELQIAVNTLGFGNVIKFVLVFKEQFWISDHKLEQLGFAFSDEKIPTWWTALPGTSPILTGWLAGPPSNEYTNSSKENLQQIALISLSHIFGEELDFLQANLVDSHIYNWANDSFSKGAYSYPTLNAEEAIKILKQPVQDTLYFAGEAIYTGSAKGTVEAALVSGKEVAKKIGRKL